MQRPSQQSSTSLRFLVLLGIAVLLVTTWPTAQPLTHVVAAGISREQDILAQRPFPGASAWVPTNGEAANLVLGQPNFTSNTSATTQTGMNSARGIAIDPVSGKVFIADEQNNRVLRFANLVSLQNGSAADGVFGQANFTSNANATTATGLSNPSGVNVDSSGTLWVVDKSNNRVLRFADAASKANGSPADGVLGQPDFTSSGNATTATGMLVPEGVVMDSAGTLWVSDSLNNRVLRFANAASKANGSPADGVLGQPDFTTGSNPFDSTASTMYFPKGVATDSSGTLWVADSFSNRVLRFANAASKANGSPADGVLGQPDFTLTFNATTPRGMASPTDVTVDSSGTLWVTDTSNNRALRFANASSLGNGAPADGVLGQATLFSSAAATTERGLNAPNGVTVDSTGTLWIADTSNHRVVHFGPIPGAPTATPTATSTITPTPAVTATPGGQVPINGQAATLVLGQPDFTSNTKNTTQDGMKSPRGIVVDPVTGKVFVADGSNNRVLRFANVASLQNGAAAEGVLGQPDFISNGSATTATGMNFPTGVAVDTNGTLWVVENFNHRVLRFADADSKGNGAAADGVLGQPDFTSNVPASTSSGLRNPYGVAVDTNGTLWVAEASNNRVVKFANASSKANGAPADGVLGQANFTSRGAGTSATEMYSPLGVTVDSSGTLWVGDALNHRVLRFTNASNKVNGGPADGVLGQANFANAAPATSATGMNNPVGVTVDSSGTLWVADTFNNRVLRFVNAVNKANGDAADGVLGQPTFTSEAGVTTATGMYAPYGIIVDSSGTLWVADTFNNRALHFGPLSGASTATPTATTTSTPTATPTGTATAIPTPTATVQQWHVYLSHIQQ